MADARPGEIEWVERGGAVEFAVKVVPGASRTRLAGVLGGALRIAVSAPPEGGRANAAVVETLAHVLAVRKGNIAIISGLTQPRKRIRVNGLTAALAAQRVRAALEP